MCSSAFFEAPALKRSSQRILSSHPSPWILAKLSRAAEILGDSERLRDCLKSSSEALLLFFLRTHVVFIGITCITLGVSALISKPIGIKAAKSPIIFLRGETELGACSGGP